MKCNIKGCPGEYEPRTITHTVRQGGRGVVIDHVPAETLFELLNAIENSERQTG
jgi:aspartate carbamoyltransferase regulatory subunit